jgi:glutamine kinase
LRILQNAADDWVVDDFLSFSLKQWRRSESSVLTRISRQFDPSSPLIIRSSTVEEDARGGFLAGAFRSSLAIRARNKGELLARIQQVAKSFGKCGRAVREADEIIVQYYVSRSKIRGVILTWDLWQGGPYYVINFLTTEPSEGSVTAGYPSQTLRVFRGVKASQLPKIWHDLLDCIKKVERLFANEILDIEFCVDQNNATHVFQARCLRRQETRAARRKLGASQNLLNILCKRAASLVRPHNSDCDRTVLSDMADWNPAEMLGPRPRPLDTSLYRFLITSGTWNIGRVSLGYADVTPSELMVTLADKPYIDCRVSLNSLTPTTIPTLLRREIVAHGIETLIKNPELHDKIEFDVAFSSFDFAIDQRLKQLATAGVTRSDIRKIKQALLQSTNKLLKLSDGIIDSDVASMKIGPRNPTFPIDLSSDGPTELLAACRLLHQCRNSLITPFVRLARLAFIGMSFLRTMVREGIISERDSDLFLRSLNTIASEVQGAVTAVSQNRLTVDAFMERFGHLRPMTYDITSLRYDQIRSGFWPDHELQTGSKMVCNRPFDRRAVSRITKFAKLHKLAFDGPSLLAFIRKAIEAREYAKFQFTKNLSDALEHLAAFGKSVKVQRQQLASIPIDILLQAAQDRTLNSRKASTFFQLVIDQNAAQREANSLISLPPFVSSPSDLLVITYPQNQPTFTTKQRVEGKMVLVSTLYPAHKQAIRDVIVLLEQADPGFDWIFAHGPKGLVTKYGGAGSHMTVRCGALGLPAAIGCGEVIFERLLGARVVQLNCKDGIVVPIQ